MVIVDDTPPGTIVCGCGYLPCRITNCSRPSRQKSSPSRYRAPVSGLRATMMSAIVRKPCTSLPGHSHFSAFGHSSGLVSLMTDSE
jgi:hypothetical protein